MKNPLSLQTDLHNRVYGLDVFRTVAILIVVLSHGGFMLTGPLGAFPWIPLPDGVDLFFVLSGFLIGTMLLKQLSSDQKFGGKELFTFWKRRWFRTLPAYYLILLLNYLVVKNGIIDGDITVFGWKFFVFLQNFATPLVGFFWESWSLSVEEWFYLILPAICLIIIPELPVRRGYLIAIAILILTPLLYRYFISGENVDHFYWDVTFRKMVVTRLDSIGFGVLAAWCKFYYKDAWTHHRTALFIAGLLITVGLLHVPKQENTLFFKTLYFTIIPFGMALMLPFADGVKGYKTRFGSAITHISLISYSMYLINLALVAQVIQKNYPPVSFADGLIKYFIYWFVVIVASTLMYKFYEKPMTDLRDKV